MAGEKARPERVSRSLWAQTEPLALSKQGVRSKSSASWPGRVIANHIPRSRSDLHAQIRATANVTISHLVFLFPVRNIVDSAKTAHVDVLASLHQHLGRGHNKR